MTVAARKHTSTLQLASVTAHKITLAADNKAKKLLTPMFLKTLLMQQAFPKGDAPNRIGHLASEYHRAGSLHVFLAVEYSQSISKWNAVCMIGAAAC